MEKNIFDKPITITSADLVRVYDMLATEGETAELMGFIIGMSALTFPERSYAEHVMALWFLLSSVSE